MPVRLLTDDGHADPSLSGTPHGVLAELAEALHASAWRLSEREQCHLQQLVALQRWRR
ncbi:hypothetical protein LZ017_18485 [Pelomonas sp. CA6]|uniref:hypothetical protein n=1 Tax=Pelomonas sp. CA6 TaxID=2907999 RepID=UPI001F4BDCE2|nr:hypothetical protein [Pelomonas sp. CA6]MCH7345372.1 hypothetical protein [Pelomonas sp. CA6]